MSSGRGCCGNRPYFKKKEICCGDKVYNKKTSGCCGNRPFMKGSVSLLNYLEEMNLENWTVKSKIFLLWWQSNVQRSWWSWKMLWGNHRQVIATCKTTILISLFSAEMYDPSKGFKCCANKEVADDEQKCCGNSIIPKSRSCCRPRNYLMSSVGFSYNPRSQG